MSFTELPWQPSKKNGEKPTALGHGCEADEVHEETNLASTAASDLKA